MVGDPVCWSTERGTAMAGGADALRLMGLAFDALAAVEPSLQASSEPTSRAAPTTTKHL
jgi:hypothetical protein